MAGDSDVARLTTLTLSDLEPVNVSWLMVSADSGQAGPAQVPPQPPTNLQASVIQNIPLSEDGAVAGAKVTVGGRPLLQKDFHDTLRRVAIPEFRTFSLLTVAAQDLARFGLNLLEVLTDNMIRASCNRHRALGVFSQC